MLLGAASLSIRFETAAALSVLKSGLFHQKWNVNNFIEIFCVSFEKKTCERKLVTNEKLNSCKGISKRNRRFACGLGQMPFPWIASCNPHEALHISLGESVLSMKLDDC